MDYFSLPLDTPGSPFLKEKKIYESTRSRNYRMQRCATCATLFLDSTRSYLQTPPIIAAHTNTGIYVRFRKERNSFERSADTLLYGSSLRHTDSNVDYVKHINAQTKLLKEAYEILVTGKTDTPSGDHVIMYIKVTNLLLPAKFIKGLSCTHPHVWIVDKLPDYDGKTMSYPRNAVVESTDKFIDRMVSTSKVATESNPGKKVYLKFNIRVCDFKIMFAEIDVDVAC
jgi:hypothetical protein